MAAAGPPRPRIRMRDYPVRFLELAGPVGVGLALAAACFIGLGVTLNDGFAPAVFAAGAGFFLFATGAIVLRRGWALLLALLARGRPPSTR